MGVVSLLSGSTVSELKLSAVAVLTNLALCQDLRCLIPPAEIVEACRNAEAELLEQGLICLYLLASREMKAQVQAAGASQLADSALGHADSSVDSWGAKLRKALL